MCVAVGVGAASQLTAKENSGLLLRYIIPRIPVVNDHCLGDSSEGNAFLNTSFYS
jgi:hypothetical protein